QMLPAAEYAKDVKLTIPTYQRKKQANKMLKGVDVFVDWKGSNPDELAEKLTKLNSDIKLTMITNRGVKVWPEGFEETFCTDHWRCRYEVENGHPAAKHSIPELLSNALQEDVDVIKTENLYEFDGVRGYSLGQGQ
ncbi:MAG: NADP-dependent isocitrate dehydrogenase, partial [Bacteroidota bacterium]